MGRAAELAVLRGLLADVENGRGGALLLEGAPGIGKSDLIARATEGLAADRVTVLHGRADEFCVNLPFQLVTDVLRPVRRGAAEVTAPASRSLWDAGAGDRFAAGVEAAVAEFERACAVRPVVVVVSDLQWADEASLAVLASLVRLTEQIPLLLLADQVPGRDEVGQLRRTMLGRGGQILPLQPLSADESARLAGEFLSTDIGPALRGQIERAGGNPLYIRELVLALRREDRIRTGAGVAELLPHPDRDRPLPGSLGAAIADRIGFLAKDTLEVLRTASVLGTTFSLTELSAVLDWPTPKVIEALQEAVATGILADTGQGLHFRSPLVRSALYESMPMTVRSLRHQQTARVLADAGLAPERVAAQLLQMTGAVDGWTLDWLCEAATTLLYQAPQLAVDLLGRVLGDASDYTHGELARDDPRREPLEPVLAMAAMRRGEFGQAEVIATRILARTGSVERAGEMTWLLGYTLLCVDRHAEAIEVVSSAGRRWDLDPVWDARIQALHGQLLYHAGVADQSRAVTEQALELGRRLGDAPTITRAASMMATEARMVLETEQVLPYLDEGIAAAAEVPELSDVRVSLLVNKTLTQIERGEPDDRVEATLRAVRRLAEQTGSARLGIVLVCASEFAFRKGRWDDALADLDASLDLPDTTKLAVLIHGIGALIALHRGRLATAREHLAHCPDNLATMDQHARANASDLLRARALLADREGRRDEALAILEETTTDAYASLVLDRHEWMPFLTRTALAAGRDDLATAATEAVRKDLARYHRPDYVASVQHCQGLLTRDPEPLRQALAYHRSVSRVLDGASCAEDLAVVLATTGNPDDARTAMHEAANAYLALDATGELARADARWREAGLRRGIQGTRKRPTTGLASLTPTEHRIAQLVAEGLSNPDIAERVYSSRRTVQTHVSHILAKLGLHSRAEIIRTLTKA
ncbi:AAA family ATPase [Streptomyces sp. NPDC050848]|uniref:helix-turn-helix transcriptional regulator n=1 Tax=Streptomyces sp. NPDC050848 TaxID=3155791 RepID=UPI0033C81DC2